MKLGATKEEVFKEEQEDVIAFGKYKGYQISNLRTNYILFLLRECSWITDSFKDKLYKEIDKRKKETPCFLRAYDSQSNTCGSCPFMEECADLM